MSDAATFLAQNPLFAKGLTDTDREVIDDLAEPHSGGLVVLGMPLSGTLYVKAHDSWGDDGKVVVHTYDTEEDDSDGVIAGATGDVEEYFDNGHAALARLLQIVEES